MHVVAEIENMCAASVILAFFFFASFVSVKEKLHMKLKQSLTLRLQIFLRIKLCFFFFISNFLFVCVYTFYLFSR